MLKLYCRQCGSPNEYTLNKPKFCQGCGQTLAVEQFTSLTPSKASLETENINPVEIEDDDDIEERETFDVDLSAIEANGLDIEITLDNPRTRTEMAGDIMQSAKTPNKTTPKKRGRPKGSKNKPKPRAKSNK